MKIKVLPYSHTWKIDFNKAKNFYDRLFEHLHVEVVHVGSTSVEGMWAKPILDIDIIVNDEDTLKQVIELLESVGYEHRGNLGIEGREAFGYQENNPNITWMKHHLYACIRGCESLNNHLLLKQHLENHPKAVEAYSQLKRDLAKSCGDDMDMYVEKKTALITGFLKAEGMNHDVLDRIKQANKKID